MIVRNAVVLLAGLSTVLLAQQEPGQQAPGEQHPTPQAAVASAGPRTYTVDTGTRVLLNLINSVSTKSAAAGDRVYLETAFPVLVGGRIVVPPGSYVAGTVTEVKRAGKMKGRAEMYIRFDSLTLPNGVTRDFRGRPGSLDGRANETLDRTEGKIKGDSDKGGDAMKVGEATAYGAMIGGLAARSGMGAGVGAAAGAAAGLVGVMFARGPDAVLERGSTMEMVLDRPLDFTEDELASNMPQQRPMVTGGGPSKDQKKGWPGTRRFPL